MYLFGIWVAGSQKAKSEKKKKQLHWLSVQFPGWTGSSYLNLSPKLSILTSLSSGSFIVSAPTLSSSIHLQLFECRMREKDQVSFYICRYAVFPSMYIFGIFSKIQVAVGTRTYDSKTLMLKTPHTSVTGRSDTKLVLTKKLMTGIARFFFGCNSGMNF